MTKAVSITLAQLNALNPCHEAMIRIKNLPKNGEITAATAIKCGATLGDIVWAASALAATSPDVDRRLRLWTSDCAAHVLHFYEKDERGNAPREAIIAARQFARGEIDAAAMDAAVDAAIDAARAAAWDAARAAAWAAARDASRDVSRAAATAAAMMDAAMDAARAAATDAATDKENDWQIDRLIARLSDNEPEDWPLGEIP